MEGVGQGDTVDAMIFPLDRYARLFQRSETLMPGTEDSWEFYDATEQALEMTLMKNHMLLIHHSKTLLETLDMSEPSMLRGVCRGSSMLIICRLRTHTRRFRVKFKEHENSTAVENCNKVANILSKYFPLKISSIEKDMTKETSVNQTLIGEVTLGQISQVLTKKGQGSLPMAYNAVRLTQPANIDSIVRLCLADPSFPAFVESVEKTLLNIQGECK
ncbi:hypothetical protein CHS0354_014866 [Potamilus streckersoni]|uniref:Uncharacterized protein n=1 Tax=Potamilus streckersoni TaxID=2493646 RepID=A0AAE0RM46_9BIVA|nr:hypothetical protein CHS0354_014866 [Potamilus streckersoni]